MSATPTFTAAHKVVIDCLGFIVAERVHHANRRLVFGLLAEALPHARAMENPMLDRLIMAAVEVNAADKSMMAAQPEAALGWMQAHMSASHAFTEFTLWRLGTSAEKFHETHALNGAA